MATPEEIFAQLEALSAPQQLPSPAVTQQAPGQQVDPQQILAQLEQIDQTQPQPGVGLTTFAEPALVLATGAIAEPIAGLAGIAQAVNPFAEPGAGARAVEATREALTFQPKTEAGQRGIRAVSEALQPIASALEKAETTLGDSTFKATGSPALAAAAATIPTAIIEAVGAGTGKRFVQANRIAKNKLRAGKIAREISDAVPTIDQLKDTARAVYREIDDLGVSVRSSAFDRLAGKLQAEARNAGLDPDITPKSSKALNRFEELRGQDVSLTEIDTLRKVAQNAAKSLEPAESALGARMIDTIDEFLDKSDEAIFLRPTASRGEQIGAFKRRPLPKDQQPNVGKRYKAARDMWGRARRSELIQEAFERARNQATGFENGIRTQFRQILNNKKQRRFFTRDELKAMSAVVRGTKKQNIAKFIGKLGFSEGGATNILGSAAGAAGGAAAFGTPGAVIVPVIGQVSKGLAQRMTMKGAEFADQVIRSGKNAKKITEAYLRNTPKKARSSAELSELLIRGDIDLAKLPKTSLAQEAGRLAQNRRAQLAGAVAPQAIEPTTEGQ